MTHLCMLKLKPSCCSLKLWLESEAYNEVCLLCARVGGYLGKDWDTEGIGNLQILGGLHANMRNSKPVSIGIEIGSEWYGAYTCFPITTTQFEWGSGFYIG